MGLLLAAALEGWFGGFGGWAGGTSQIFITFRGRGRGKDCREALVVGVVVVVVLVVLVAF